MLTVSENYVGPVPPSVANFTVDYQVRECASLAENARVVPFFASQGAELLYAIAFGNDAGYFQINSTTGVVSVLSSGPGLRGGLNFELQSGSCRPLMPRCLKCAPRRLARL